MKKQLSPGVVVLIIAIAVVIIGLIYFKADMGGGKRTAEMEEMINRTAAVGGDMKAPAAPTPPAKQ